MHPAFPFWPDLTPIRDRNFVNQRFLKIGNCIGQTLMRHVASGSCLRYQGVLISGKSIVQGAFRSDSLGGFSTIYGTAGTTALSGSLLIMALDEILKNKCRK
jgi:hypothetical protein